MSTKTPSALSQDLLLAAKYHYGETTGLIRTMLIICHHHRGLKLEQTETQHNPYILSFHDGVMLATDLLTAAAQYGLNIAESLESRTPQSPKLFSTLYGNELVSQLIWLLAGLVMRDENGNVLIPMPEVDPVIVQILEETKRGDRTERIAEGVQREGWFTIKPYLKKT